MGTAPLPSVTKRHVLIQYVDVHTQTHISTQRQGHTCMRVLVYDCAEIEK